MLFTKTMMLDSFLITVKCESNNNNNKIKNNTFYFKALF